MARAPWCPGGGSSFAVQWTFLLTEVFPKNRRILQKAGHQIIILLGSGTSKIGDPSGKDKSRQLLNDKEIKKNSENIKKI